jgi:predicted DNA binding CopG/RHH family protein
MKKKLPNFRTDAEAEHFVETADLSEYDLSGLVRVRFEFKDTTAQTAATRDDAQPPRKKT